MWPHQAPTCSPRSQQASDRVPAGNDVATLPLACWRSGQSWSCCRNTHFGASRLWPSRPPPWRCGEPVGISLKCRRALERSRSSGTGSLFLGKKKKKKKSKGSGASKAQHSRGGGRSSRARGGALILGSRGPSASRSGPAPQQVSAICFPHTAIGNVPSPGPAGS